MTKTSLSATDEKIVKSNAFIEVKMEFPVFELSQMSQIEYVTYARHLEDVKVIEQCYRKGQVWRVSFNGHRFLK